MNWKDIIVFFGKTCYSFIPMFFENILTKNKDDKQMLTQHSLDLVKEKEILMLQLRLGKHDEFLIALKQYSKYVDLSITNLERYIYNIKNLTLAQAEEKESTLNNDRDKIKDNLNHLIDFYPEIKDSLLLFFDLYNEIDYSIYTAFKNSDVFLSDIGVATIKDVREKKINFDKQFNKVIKEFSDFTSKTVQG